MNVPLKTEYKTFSISQYDDPTVVQPCPIYLPWNHKQPPLSVSHHVELSVNTSAFGVKKVVFSPAARDGLSIVVAPCYIYLSIKNVSRKGKLFHRQAWNLAPRVRPAIKNRDAGGGCVVDGSANVIDIRTNRQSALYEN